MARPSLNGVRVHVMIPKQQAVALRKYADKTGLTMAEQIRRALDFYLASAAERMSRRP